MDELTLLTKRVIELERLIKGLDKLDVRIGVLEAARQVQIAINAKQEVLNKEFSKKPVIDIKPAPTDKSWKFW